MTQPQMLDPAIMAALLASAPIEHTDTDEEVIEPNDDHAAVLADILRKAKGVRESGEKLVDDYIAAVWAKRKLSKLDAARAGLVASDHNPRVWAQLQTLRGEMKTAVRKAARESAHVAPKVAAAKTEARTPELDAFLLQHQGDPAIQKLAALLGL